MALVNAVNKICPRCGLEKLAEGSFYRTRRTTGDGFHGYCIPCVKVKAVEWQKTNPEKKAASDKKQDQKPERKARALLRTVAWVKRNPSKEKERQARYRDQNRTALNARHRVRNRTPERRKYHNEWMKRWYFTPAGQARAKMRRELRRITMSSQVYESNRRVKRQYGVEARFFLDDWLQVLDNYEHRCCYCGAGGKLEVEHLTPLIRAMSMQEILTRLHCVGNVAPACRSCNASKHDKTLEEFAILRGLSAAEIRARSVRHLGE